MREWKATNSIPVKHVVCEITSILICIFSFYSMMWPRWLLRWKDTCLEKSPKLPDQRGLLKNSITIELPFIQFHLTLLNSPYGWESAGGRTPDTGQPATAKFLHLWSIELCVTWVCVCVCADVSICAYIHCALLMPAFILQPRWGTTERVCDYGQTWTRPGGIGKMSVPS